MGSPVDSKPGQEGAVGVGMNALHEGEHKPKRQLYPKRVQDCQPLATSCPGPEKGGAESRIPRTPDYFVNRMPMPSTRVTLRLKRIQYWV